MKQDLLIEIGTEEIPARFIADAEKSLGEKMKQWLQSQSLSFDAVQTFSTPRRLAVIVQKVSEKQADRSTEVRGPAAKIAQSADGSWSKAAMGFARKQGLDVTDLQIKEHNGNQYVFATKHETGLPTVDLIEDQLAKEVLDAITFPLTMRWNAGTRFIRPVRWLVCMFGTSVVPVKWAGVTADQTSRGHRFLGATVTIESPQAYAAQLQDVAVWVNVKQRQNAIISQLQELEDEHGWNIPIDPELLAEVTHLVEYPTVVTGTFKPEFLELPKPVLITTMREHQRYFPVEDGQQNLLPYFVTVRNGDRRHLELVAKGNEKVLEARLADARFFYHEDRKLAIDDAVTQLDRIIFRQELGSIGDRVRRIEKLAALIGAELACPADELKQLTRAAKICKFDLATQMVDEFSKLEGTMGAAYALAAGEDPSVAKAIAEHVRPRSATDRLPEGRLGTILALADRLDMLASCLGIGIAPTGSQDPYSLRRHALAVLQLLLHYPQLSLRQLMQAAIAQLESLGLLKLPAPDVAKDMMTFLAARFRSVLQEAKIRYDVIDAIIARPIDQPSKMRERAQVLMAHVEQESFKHEVEAFTRVANLVYANEPKAAFVEEHITESAEKKLLLAYQSAQVACDRAQDEAQLYQALSAMSPSIHDFFDHVMVMVEDEDLRTNRLALLQLIAQLTERFADFRKLVFL